jgi:hypothetical protein
VGGGRSLVLFAQRTVNRHEKQLATLDLRTKQVAILPVTSKDSQDPHIATKIPGKTEGSERETVLWKEFRTSRKTACKNIGSMQFADTNVVKQGKEDLDR